VAKTFSILVGRDEKVLRYTMEERKSIEKTFGASLMDILKKRAFSDNGNGGWSPVGGEWEVQVEMVYLGLKHLGAAVTRKKVEEWMKAAIETDAAGVVPYLVSAGNAIMASGILGTRYESPDEPEETDSGKADAQAPESGEQN
jgi:hypothetical protein